MLLIVFLTMCDHFLNNLTVSTSITTNYTNRTTKFITNFQTI